MLSKNIKGYEMGEAGEGQNITQQQKKMGEAALRAFRDRFRIPISDDKIAETPFYKTADDSPEIQYLKQRRAELGGSLPMRKPVKSTLVSPALSAFDKITAGTGDRQCVL